MYPKRYLLAIYILILLWKPRRVLLIVYKHSALASVTPPDIFYELHLPQKIIDNTLLSSLQLETILYACQRHTMFSPQGRCYLNESSIGYRYGFLLGDGAGVGKGRTIAGIIYENYLLSRKRALW